jgi:SagB-type dehydrogenase family enzyme
MASLICTEFWRCTQYDHMDQPDQARGVPAPPLELPVDPGSPRTALPDPRSFACAPADIGRLMAARRTMRTYSPQPLSPLELSFLLWSAQGVLSTDAGKTLRTAPSAGARHAFETIVLANNVSSLAPGLYRFVPTTHDLVALSAEPTRINDLVDSFRNIVLARSSAAVFIWVAVADRMTWKFGARGWRYLLLDAGHACQNLYLAAEAMGCGVCAIGAFNDADMNTALGLDGTSQFVVYAASIGHKPA